MSNKTLDDVLAKAATDPAFAQEVLSNPGQFREEYNLSDEHLESINAAGVYASATRSGTVHPDGYESGGGGS